MTVGGVRRAHLLVVAALATLALVGVGVWLGSGGERLAGTNSIAPKQQVVEVAPGQELCLRRLRVPAGTAAVRLQLGAPAAAEARLALRLPDGERRSTAQLGGLRRSGDFPVREVEAETVGDACLSVAGAPVGVSGVPGVQSDGDDEARLDGERLDARVAVAFVLGGEPTLLSRVDDAMRHAAVFKPGFSGAWTYWALLALVPLLWLAGLRRLTGRRPAGRRLPAVWLVGLLAFGNAGAWALITPAFEGPDEYAHVAYALHLAEAGHSPGPDSGGRFTSSEHVLALELTNAFGIHRTAQSRPPWSPAQERRFDRLLAERDPPRDDGGGAITTDVHGPGYYAAPAALYRIAEGSFFDRLFAMRLASALFAALTAMCAFGIVGELLPGRPWAALAGGLLVAFQPMLSFMGGVVNADMGVNFAGAALLYLLVRALRRGLTPGVAALIPLVFVFGVLAKATMLSLAPVLVAALALLAWRRAASARAWGAMGGALAVLVLAWLGIAQALDRDALPLPDTSAGSYTIPQALSYLWQQFLPHLPFMTDLYDGRYVVPGFSLYAIQLWAAFGWLSVVFPDPVYYVLAAVLLGVAALAVVVLVRERPAVRARWAELSVLALGFVCVAVFAHLAFVRTDGPSAIIAEQGRYLFPAIVVPAVAAVGACFAFGRTRAPLLATGLVTAMMLFCGSCQLFTFASYYA